MLKNAWSLEMSLLGPSPSAATSSVAAHIRGIVHLLLRTEDADVRLLDADGALVWLQPNYADLVRVYTTPELMEWFRWVILAEEQVRSDVHRYSLTGLSPKELAVRIPLHPERALRPASAAENEACTNVRTRLGWTNRAKRSFAC